MVHNYYLCIVELIHINMKEIIGYARVSAIDQNLDIQITELKKAGCTRIFSDKITGTSFNREGLSEAFKIMREGDEFVVGNIFRLGRSTVDIIQTINYIVDNKCVFRSLDLNIDSTTVSGTLVIQVFAAISQFIRSHNRERALSGIENAKKKGIKLGRREGVNIEKFNKVKALANQYSIHEISKLTNISVSSVKRYKKKIREV